MFKNAIKYIQSSGALGQFFGNILQFIFVNYWGLTTALIVTTLISSTTSAVFWIQQPVVRAYGEIFLIVLWGLIAIRHLANKNRVQVVRTEHDYAYALIVESGCLPVFFERSPNHSLKANESLLAISCNFRNVSAGPIKIRVDEVRIILDGRTCDDSPPVDLVFPRLAHKAIRSGPVVYDTTKESVTGTAQFRLVYGHPDGDYIRKYSLKLKLQLRVVEQMGPEIKAGLDNEIIEEKDEPITSKLQ